MKTLIFSSFAALLLFASCTNSSDSTSKNKFSNPEIIRIYDLCDNRSTSSLLNYFSSADPIIRAEVALAFASIQDTMALSPLHDALNDADAMVRRNAYYAIGMTGHQSSFDYLELAYTKESDLPCRSELLEAYGRVIAAVFPKNKDLAIDRIEFLDVTRFDTDEERTGWAKGAIQVHMAKIEDERLMNRMPFVLQKTNHDARVACAFAMARFKGKDWFQDEKNAKYIKNWCRMERDVEVKIPQMLLLSKVLDQESVDLLKGYLSGHLDDNVRIAAIRSAGMSTKIQAADLLPLLKEQNDLVVEECLRALNDKDCKEYIDEIISACSGRIPLLKAMSFRILSKYDTAKAAELTWAGYNESTDPYAKSAYASQLFTMKVDEDRFMEAYRNANDYVVKTTLVQAFFDMNLTSMPNGIEGFLSRAMEMFDGNDVGVQALVALNLREINPNAGKVDSLQVKFRSRLNTLKLPAEIETYNEILQTLNKWTGEKVELKKVEYNHPIDWKVIGGLAPNAKAKITTGKGEIEIELHVEQAPGSVASFVQLTNEGFFNNKSFHRVIGDFVAQGGCPRGDGFGSTDYTLRSEFALHKYDTGAIGLASSGKDTESCQFFITHTNTPHLEGRYTIFAHVVNGMDIVNKLVVGDKIISISMM